MTSPNPGRLLKSSLNPVSPGVWSRRPIDELRALIRSADLVVSDVDECMVPFIAQAEAGRIALFETVRTANKFKEILFAARMSLRGADILATKTLYSLLGLQRNSLLISKFEKFARGMSMDIIDAASLDLSARVITGAPAALREFSSRGVPVGLVSLGLEFFVAPFRVYLHTEHNLETSFHDCTPIVRENGRFAGYAPGKALKSPEDKRTAIRKRATEYSAKCPLVIGHDLDDAAMLHEAAALGGFALGINPIPEVYEHLDAAIFAPDWRPFADLAAAALYNDLDTHTAKSV